jgi:hypothetical protein
LIEREISAAVFTSSAFLFGTRGGELPLDWMKKGFGVGRKVLFFFYRERLMTRKSFHSPRDARGRGREKSETNFSIFHPPRRPEKCSSLNLYLCDRKAKRTALLAS